MKKTPLQLLITKENRGKLPIKYISPSSTIEILVNEKAFFKKYVLYKFDEKTSPAMIIGSAFHSAMEYYYSSIILNKQDKTAPILTIEEVEQKAINEMIRFFAYNERRGLERLATQKGIKDVQKIGEKYEEIMRFDWQWYHEQKAIIESEETPEEEKERIKKAIFQLKDPVVRAIGWLKGYGFEMDEDTGFFNEEIEEAKNYFIEYGKTGNKEEARDQLIQGVRNYMEAKPFLDPLFSEKSMQTEFVDFDGNDMPVPLKGKPDLLALYCNDETIVDYKLVTKFGERTGAYEIQASSYYFIAQAILGRAVKRMIYIEVLKRETKAGAGMLKGGLEALCQQNEIEMEMTKTGKVKDTVAILKEKLEAKGIIKSEYPINIIEINFEEEPELVQAFVEIYKEMLNRFYYYFIEKTIRFLPNPKADFTGPESWEDFKFETVNEVDIIGLVLQRNTEIEPDIKIEF